jgi:hypothetical protein
LVVDDMVDPVRTRFDSGVECRRRIVSMDEGERCVLPSQ